MFKHFLLIFAFSLILASCQTLKTIKLLKGGEVVQKEFKTTVPFEMRMGLIVLKVKINGEYYDFVLDTGAPNVISKELALTLKLRNLSERKVSDSQNASQNLGFTKVPKIEIGGIEFTNTGAAIADLKTSSAVECLDVYGFIGANLMRKAIWEFDFIKKTITIRTKMRELEPDTKHVPFTSLISGTPKINVNLETVAEKNVSVDFGSTGGFSCSKQAYKNLLLLNNQRNVVKGYGSASSGLYGAGKFDTTFVMIVNNVNIDNGVSLNEQLISFEKDGSKLLGLRFFENYHVTFDWTKNELLLLPNGNQTKNSVEGFGFKPIFQDNKLKVGFVYLNTPAFASGIRPGDEIIELAQRKYKNPVIIEWCNVLRKGIYAENATEINVMIKKADNNVEEYTLKKEKLLE